MPLQSANVGGGYWRQVVGGVDIVVVPEPEGNRFSWNLAVDTPGAPMWEGWRHVDLPDGITMLPDTKIYAIIDGSWHPSADGFAIYFVARSRNNDGNCIVRYSFNYLPNRPGGLPGVFNYDQLFFNVWTKAAIGTTLATAIAQTANPVFQHPASVISHYVFFLDADGHLLYWEFKWKPLNGNVTSYDAECVDLDWLRFLPELEQKPPIPPLDPKSPLAATNSTFWDGPLVVARTIHQNELVAVYFNTAQPYLVGWQFTPPFLLTDPDYRIKAPPEPPDPWKKPWHDAGAPGGGPDLWWPPQPPPPQGKVPDPTVPGPARVGDSIAIIRMPPLTLARALPEFGRPPVPPFERGEWICVAGLSGRGQPSLYEVRFNRVADTPGVLHDPSTGYASFAELGDRVKIPFDHNAYLRFGLDLQLDFPGGQLLGSYHIPVPADTDRLGQVMGAGVLPWPFLFQDVFVRVVDAHGVARPFLARLWDEPDPNNGDILQTWFDLGDNLRIANWRPGFGFIGNGMLTAAIYPPDRGTNYPRRTYAYFGLCLTQHAEKEVCELRCPLTGDGPPTMKGPSPTAEFVWTYKPGQP